MARGLSIKYKLLILLTLVPVIALGIYAFVAIDLFKKDKIAYVYDSTSAISSSLSAQVRSEVSTLTSYVRPLVAGYIFETRRFSPSTRSLFATDENIDYLAIHHFDGRGGYRIGSRLRQSSFRPQGNWVETETGQAMVKKAAELGFYLQFLGPQHVVFAFRNGEASTDDHTVIFAIGRSSGLAESFQSATSNASFLLDSSGAVIAGQSALDIDTRFQAWEFFSELQSQNIEERAMETISPTGESFLISYARVGAGGLIVLSVVRKEEALVAAGILLTKSMIFLVAILSVSLFVSILASGRLTSALTTLSLAARKVAGGDYNVQVQVKTRDEVQGLAETFNMMTSEVHRLMVENVEKARMEKELETAKVVQDALFPDTEGSVGNVLVKGYYTSASECGGDWWHYCDIEDRVFLWIGDATGHGAPAALITSAAKAVASIVETMPSLKPSQIMSMLNTAIHENSKGKICMTFFLASVDKTSGEMSFCNASHEPPIRIPETGEEPLKRKDLEPIISESYSRLGESLDSTYKDETMELNDGDSVFFYTDGVTELVGPEGMFEERRLLRSLVSGAKVKEGARGIMNQLEEDLEEFRQEHPLEDDVTYFVASFQREGVSGSST